MKTCKIAITIPINLLKTINRFSKKLKVSRSKIISKGACIISDKLEKEKIADIYNEVFSDKQVQKKQKEMSESFLSISSILKNEY